MEKMGKPAKLFSSGPARMAFCYSWTRLTGRRGGITMSPSGGREGRRCGYAHAQRTKNCGRKARHGAKTAEYPCDPGVYTGKLPAMAVPEGLWVVKQPAAGR